MIAIRKVITKEYLSINDFVKNEKFNLNFKFAKKGMLEISIMYSDPITKDLSEVYKFMFSQEEFLKNYQEEQDFKNHISSDPDKLFN